MQCNPSTARCWTLLLLTCWSLAGCRAIAGYDAAGFAGEAIPGGGIGGARLPGLLHIFTTERFVDAPLPHVDLWVQDGAELRKLTTDEQGHAALAVRSASVAVHALVEVVGKADLTHVRSIFGVEGNELTLALHGPVPLAVKKITSTLGLPKPATPTAYATVTMFRDLPFVASKRNLMAYLAGNESWPVDDNGNFFGWVLADDPTPLSCGFVELTSKGHRLTHFGRATLADPLACPLERLGDDLLELAPSKVFETWSTHYVSIGILRADGRLILSPPIDVASAQNTFNKPPLQTPDEQHLLFLTGTPPPADSSLEAWAYCLQRVARDQNSVAACALPPPLASTNWATPGQLLFATGEERPPFLTVYVYEADDTGIVARWGAVDLRPGVSEMMLPAELRRALAAHLTGSALVARISAVYLHSPLVPNALRYNTLHETLLGGSTRNQGVPKSWLMP